MTEVRAAEPLLEHLFRREAGRMTAHLARLFGPENLELAEDAVAGHVVTDHRLLGVEVLVAIFVCTFNLPHVGGDDEVVKMSQSWRVANFKGEQAAEGSNNRQK